MSRLPPAHIERLRKWRFLDYYLPIYSKIITAHFPSCYYIDMFAGAGHQTIPGIGTVIGSPLRALQVAYPFSNYVFVEKYPNESKALSEALENPRYLALKGKYLWKVSAPIQKAVKIAQLRGDVNTLLPGILAPIPREIPIFAFVDPHGIGDMPWSTAIAPFIGRRSELLINFSIMGINRNPHNPELLDALYGDDSWKGCDSEEDYVELYKIKLKQYWTYVFSTPPFRTETDNVLYCLIFATKNPTAKRIWEQDVLHRVQEIWAERDLEAWLGTKKQASLRRFEASKTAKAK